MQDKVKLVPCLGGGIGRRAGLKIQYRKVCRFDSDPRHHSFRYATRASTSVEMLERFYAKHLTPEMNVDKLKSMKKHRNEDQ